MTPSQYHTKVWEMQCCFGEKIYQLVVGMQHGNYCCDLPDKLLWGMWMIQLLNTLNPVAGEDGEIDEDATNDQSFITVEQSNEIFFALATKCA